MNDAHSHDKWFNEGICSVEGKIMSYVLRQSIKADMRVALFDISWAEMIEM